MKLMGWESVAAMVPVRFWFKGVQSEKVGGVDDRDKKVLNFRVLVVLKAGEVITMTWG